MIPPDLIDSKARTFRVEIDIAQGIEQKTMSECVQRKILSLPEIYSTPLFLDMQGYSDQEIAAILNCTLQNAKIRLHRGRKKIEEVLSNDCSLYYDERNILCCVHKD